MNQELLKQTFNYDKETGIFTRKKRTSNNVKIGDVAGFIDNNGYWIFHLKEKHIKHIGSHLFI